MSTGRDWLPANRDEQLAMAKNWSLILADKGPAWNVPKAGTKELAELSAAADAALATAKNEATRTPVATARCRETFLALEGRMRDIKKRFFYAPPLTQADIVSLGLKPRDSTPTPSGPPSAQATVETYLLGRHELGVKIIYVTGNPADPANKGFRVWYTVVAPGETPPGDPEQLGKSICTKRKKDMIEFGYSGKTAYFAVQIENEGKKGPWGPLVSALIP